MEPNQHPITPPPELVSQWFLGAKAMPVNQWVTDVATQAAQWGADIELEACEALILKMRPHGGRAWTCEQAAVNDALTAVAVELRTARRPKPPSLKELALKAIGVPAKIGEARVIEHREHELIRRALEQLDD